MLLDLLKAAPGVASVGTPPVVAPAVMNAVDAIKQALQDLTKKPRNYVVIDEHITGGSIGTRWRTLSTALRQTAQASAVAIADQMDAVAFPAAPPVTAAEAGFASGQCIEAMHGALNFAARQHARSRVDETLRLSTLTSDRRAAREFFFSSLESVYVASKAMAPMTTSSTGTPSFQRGIHGAVIEEAFRYWLRARVAPLAVSTGTIIGAPAKDQLDVIIWDPRYVADVVRVGDVAYVPAPAVRGILEVKGGHPAPGVVAQRLYEIQATHQALCQQQGRPVGDVPVLGVLIADATQYETVSGKGAGLVVALFLIRGTELKRNEEAFSRLQRFLHDVGDYAR